MHTTDNDESATKLFPEDLRATKNAVRDFQTEKINQSISLFADDS